MDYESMTTPQLQAECKHRGLPSARAKADLVQRLTEHDAAAADESSELVAEDGAEFDPEPSAEAEAGEAPQADVDDFEPVAEGDSTPVRAPEPAPAPAAPTLFRQTFPAGPEGPDEEEHLAYRQTTRQAAVEAGLVPRGDAYRTGTVDGHEVYEVRVRAAS